MRDLLPVALEVNNDPSVVYTSHDHQLLYMRYTTCLPTVQFTQPVQCIMLVNANVKEMQAM